MRPFQVDLMLRNVSVARAICANGHPDAGRSFAARVAAHVLGIMCALSLTAPVVVAQPTTGTAAIPPPSADDKDQAIGSAAPPRGIIVALARAALTTELNVPVSEIGFREAEVFDKGDLLIAFDCRRQQAELKSAEAKAAEARLTLQNYRYLKRRRATGAHDVAVAAARYKQAEADVDAIKVVLDGCQVRAPFRGAVSSLSLRVHERPSVGEPFMRIVSNEAFELEMIVPSTWLKWLRPGRAFRFHVDEIDEALPANIARVGRAIDPVSQTVKAYASFSGGRDALRAGMSGTAHFAQSDGR